MADAFGAAFSFTRAAPSVPPRKNGRRHDRDSLYVSTGPQAAAGHGAAVVVQKPLSRLARAAPLPGIHETLRSHGHPQSQEPMRPAMEPDDASTVGSRASAPGDCNMSNKADSKNTDKDAKTNDAKTSEKHPGMMGDGTEEQNLGQPGNPGARIKKDEVDAAFNKDGKK